MEQKLVATPLSAGTLHQIRTKLPLASIALAASFGIYGAWYSSLPLGLDVGGNNYNQLIEDYLPDWYRHIFSSRLPLVGSDEAEESLVMDEETPRALPPTPTTSEKAIETISAPKPFPFQIRETEIPTVVPKVDTAREASIRKTVDEQRGQAYQFLKIKQHVTGRWAWFHTIFMTLGIMTFSAKVTLSAYRDELKKKFFGISNQVLAGILFPSATGFYNLVTNQLIPCCIVHASFLEPLMNYAGSSVNFVGLLFSLSGAAVLAGIAHISETVDQYIGNYSREMIERSIRDDLNKHRFLSQDGKEIGMNDIRVGHILKIRYGETMPVDGQALSGGSVMMDKLTGESDEIYIPKEGPIKAGSIVKSSNGILARVTAIGEDTTLAKIRHIALEAAQTKSTAARKVDKVAKYFSPAVTGISLALFISGAMSGSFFIMLNALALLFVLTPCALKLAIPTLTATFLVKLNNKRQLFVKRFAAFENASKIQRVFFDKTGTLVSTRNHLANVKMTEPDTDHVYDLVHSMSRHSNHPLSDFYQETSEERVTVSRGIRSIPLERVEEHEGRGLSAQYEGQMVLFGSRQLLLEQGIDESTIANFGTFNSYVAVSGKIVAGFLVKGELRSDAKEVIQVLKSQGIESAILSGDSPAETIRIARELGIPESNAYGGLMPREKMAIVEAYEKEHGAAAHVGDGTNDAPSLGRATLGIAWNAQSIACESADIIAFGGDKLMRIADIFKQERLYNRILKVNVIFPIVFNTALMFSIVTGLLSSTLLWLGGAALSGFTLPIAFLMHESVSFTMAAFSGSAYLDSPLSIVAKVRDAFAWLKSTANEKLADQTSKELVGK